MVTTCMMQIASAIVENEQKEWELKVGAQYERMMDAGEAARAHPDDFGAQIMHVLEQDRMSHISTLKDSEMNKFVQETRTYISKL